jgi:melibiase-like protein/alpha galactosidase C-like protein
LNFSRRHITLLLLCLLFMLQPACSGSSSNPADDRYVKLENSSMKIEFDLEKGRFNVNLADGTLIMENAFAEVEIGEPGENEPVIFKTTDDYTISASTAPHTDKLGQATRAEIKFSSLADAPDLTLFLSVYENQPYFTTSLQAGNPGTQEIRLARMVPTKIDESHHGALLIGEHPSNHRILESGSFFLFEFFVDLVPGDIEESAETVATGFITGYQKGHSISNWNHAIKDLDSGLGFVAGSLDFEYSSPMFNTSYDAAEAKPVGGRTPFTYWSGEFPLMPSGKPLIAGESLTVGPVLIIPATVDPLGGLERYATAIKHWNDIRLWPERNPNNRVPTGWNSWTGSGSSGGYGSGIDQQLMLDNLAAMKSEFKDFGGEWFQIDDGYQYNYGDWDWREDRFPEGSAWLADQIMNDGFIPGVWIAPFQVSEDSATFAAHNADGWFAEPIPLTGGDKPILDLTHPDVQTWLSERFRRIRADGFRWIKTDFVYYALGAAAFHDSTVTREEAYRQGLGAIQAGLQAGAADAGGESGDTFWLSVSVLGPHMGYVDSIRANLDTMPAWEKDAADQGRKTSQGFKPTVRTIARRFYLQNRALNFNHDMLFFRSHPDTSIDPITSDEAHCLCTAVGLSGSVTKLGEKLIEMQPEWINDYRKLIPVYGLAARPTDLFEREYPEVWHLHVVPEEGLNTGGVGPAYDVVALFNWGKNWDLTSNPYTEMADEARQVSVSLSSIGMDPAKKYIARDFWSGEILDSVQGTLARSVRPHSVQLFSLREELARPQYIGGNRHFLQGAVEIHQVSFDQGTKTLSMTYDAAPGSIKAPFTHELVFHLPAGWSLQDAGVTGASSGSVQTNVAGNFLTLSFEVETRQSVVISLVFSES